MEKRPTYEELEDRIKALKKESFERKRAEAALRVGKPNLSRLEEVTAALNVLLRQREQDKKELEEKVLSNVKELIAPYLERLKRTRLDEKQTAYIGIIESNLDEIISPFSRQLSSKFFSLTPKEIQVADLVKDGKTTKEIAELLNMSTRAVEFHRDNIRTKLGLKNKKANLRSRLLSLP
ncbi:MAG: helix-turn-helix transcriptional regulator [Desulfobacterales bacterium]|nr:helix-turn-helix transcriptional regulator [Desulfobacterales bacterium]